MRKLIFISAFVALALPAVAHAETGEAEAMTTAVRRAATAGLTGGLEIQSSGPVSLARARNVFEPGNSGPDPAATGYPFVLSDGSTFHANVPLPPKAHLAPQRYLAVTISEDWIEETLSPAPISIASLGTVVTVNLSATEASTASRSCHVAQLLVSALGRKHLHVRLASAQHSLKKCEAKHP